MTGMEVALASGALKVAGDKLVSLIASEFASITGVKKDLSELHGKHLVISSWLASVHDRTIGDGTMVNELRNVAYDIDDLLYGVHLEAEKHKLHGDGDRQPIADCFCSIPKSFLFRCKVARKIKEIKAKYEKIVKQSSDANIIRTNLQIDHPVRRSNWTAGELSMLSNVEDSKIPTRDKEKGEIISKILESDEGEDGRTVVSIVGLGGSGKTTLAKLICHDSKIKEHFKDMVFWVHVSEEYDVNKLIAKLFEAIIEKKADFHAQQNMLRELSKKLSGKKFFLVLDDAWHEDKYDWEQFMVHLKNGVPGSKILVTTRNKKVAEIVKSRHIFELGFLSEAETWSFFLISCGLVEENLGSEYIQVGKEILKRCSGVPLAIRTLGSMLCETNEISIWKAIRDSDLWTDESTKGRVFASLKLSFIHMEDEVKQCFIFCSIFPKGYEIYKDRLIAQWVANGFINAMNGVQPEDIGRRYFDSLVKVGFLQGPYYESLQTKRLVCKMHDVIHDLVRDILLNNAQSCRYLSLTSCAEKVDRGSFDKVHAIFVSESNPTFDKPVKKSSRVRSVVLDYRNNTLFPQFILKFEYIGYLEIHNPSCTKFPEAISDCWNLQSLHFISCYSLVTLPKSIGNLKKLRTLELNSAYDLESLPQSIGECRGLQYLHLHDCVGVSEIPSTIFNVRNLRALHITKFSYLKQLPLEFTGEFSNLQTINFAGSKLCYLPSMLSCPTLCTLDLSQTEVTILPQWVTTIGTLKCINLRCCRELVELPEGIGNLKGLSVLNITSCNELKCIPSGIGQLTRLTQLGLFVVGCGEDDARISELGNLGKLRGFMEIRNLEFLKDPCDAAKARLKEKNKIQYLELNWSSSQPEVDLATDVEQQQAVLSALEPPSQIEKLEINCYRGPCLPSWMIEQTILCQFLSLTYLRLCGFRNLKHMRGLLKFPSLKSLELSGMANLEDLWTTTSGFEVRAEDCFPALSVVSIRDCPKFITVKPYFPPSLELRLRKKCNLQLLSPGNFSHLRELQLVGTTGPSSAWEFLQHRTELEILSIHEYNDLTQLPDSIRSLTSLQLLHIIDCPTLGALPEWLGELCSLRSLVLSSTPMIASLPQSIGCLTSLTRLQIWDGSKLKQLPDAIQHLAALESLELTFCGALAVLPECIGQLSALRKLRIEGCSALECLPESIQRLTALQNLVISGCPALARRYKQGVGPDWHLLSHIPDVTIFEEH